MIDPITLERWLYRLVYLLIAAVVTFFAILPFNIGTGRLPSPDIVLLIGFAWVLRRPDYMPALLFAAVLLTQDILFMRPPGLWAGLALIALEFLRSREPMWRDLPFLFEWAMVAAVLLGMTLVQMAVLALFFVDQPGVPQVLMQASISILCYPVVTGLSRLAFRVAKPAPGEVDALGHKL
jgi:rod shape-determining protein MreD